MQQEESGVAAKAELMAPSMPVSYDALHLVWPSHDEPSIIRKHAVLVLTEDPDQRLQLQHLAALLHLRLGGPVLPDALLAALSGPGSAGMFACQAAAMQLQGYSRVPVVRLQVERLVRHLQQAAGSSSDSGAAMDQVLRPHVRQPRSSSSSSQVPEVTLQHCIQWVYDTWPSHLGDPDALLASTLALLLLFSERGSGWGSAPLQLPLEELVGALAAAVQHDERLSVLLGGPAAAGHGALEQQVLGLVSQPAFRPYFVLQSTQGGTSGTMSLQLHKLADGRLGDGSAGASGQPLLPSWVTPSDLAAGVANLHRLQLAGPGAAAPTALLRPPGPPSHRPSSGAAGGEPASRPRRDSKGWAIGPAGGSTSKASSSGDGTPRVADPVVASVGPVLNASGSMGAWGMAVGSPAGAAGFVVPPHAATSNGATKLAVPAWQQVVGFSSSSSSGGGGGGAHASRVANAQDQGGPGRAAAVAAAASAASDVPADDAAKCNWDILGSSPLTAACSEALYGLGALQAAATTAGHLEAASTALTAAAAAAAAAGGSAMAAEMMHRRSTWSGEQAGVGATTSDGLAATSVGSVPSKAAAGPTSAPHLHKEGSSSGHSPTPGSKGHATNDRHHPQVEGGASADSEAATPVADTCAPSTYGTSPGAASLSHLFMSGAGSFPTKGTGILSWSQQHSPRGVEVPQAIASCWSSRPGSATASGATAASGNNGATEAAAGSSHGRAAATAWPGSEASNASLHIQSSSVQVGSSTPRNDTQAAGAGVSLGPGALHLAQQQQLRAMAADAWSAAAAAAGGGEGSGMQRGRGAYPFAAAARGASAWSELGREDTSIMSDTEQSSEGPELFFGALGSSHPGQGPAPIASLWSRGDGPGSSRLQGTTNAAAAAAAPEADSLSAAAAAKAGGGAMQAGGGWGDADLPFDLPDEDLLLEGVCERLKGSAPEDAAHHQHQQQLLQSMIGGLEGSFATLSLGSYQQHHLHQQDLGAGSASLQGGTAAAMGVHQQLQQVIGQLMGHAASSSVPQGTAGGLTGMDGLHSMQHWPASLPANADGLGTHHPMGGAAGSVDAAARSADTEKGQRKQGMGLLLGSLPPPPPPPRRPNTQQLQGGAARSRGAGRASGMDSMGSTPRSGTPREGLLGQSPLAGSTRGAFGLQAAPGCCDNGVQDAGSGCVRNWASVAAKDPAATATPLLTPRTGAALRDVGGLGLGAAPSGTMASGLGLPSRSKAGAAPLTPSSSHPGGMPMAPGMLIGARGGHLAGAEEGMEGGPPLARLPGVVRAEVEALVAASAGVLKLEDFDAGVVHQLMARRSEAEAVAAVRYVAQHELRSIQHMAAYLNHLIKHYMPQGDADRQQPAAGRMSGPGGGAGRVPSMPVNNKAMLQKLPLKVYRRLEEVVAGCPYLDWHHFDAGVIKVLGQLSKMAEDDVFTELDLLAHADLSNVEYMPAYLNKRLNNKLWSRRKLEG